MWVLDRVAGLERAVLRLCFGAAANRKYDAGHVLGRAAALPVDNQRGKSGVREVSTLMRCKGRDLI